MKKKKHSPGRPKRVERIDAIENHTISEYFKPHGTRLLNKDSAEGDGGRKGAGTNQASCPSPLPQVEAESDN